METVVTTERIEDQRNRFTIHATVQDAVSSL